MTLQPGDVICAGSLPGVGIGMKPEPQRLNPGDQVHVWIDGLGEQRQKVVPAS
ncbi:Ureidoglycolate lyase [compost metagenome]